MTLSSAFSENSRKQKLFQQKSKVLLAVSGGLDSVVMAALFHQAKINFAIAHCNFNLRGKESEADQTFVKNLAKKYKVRFHTKKFDTGTFAEKEKLSIQEAARKLRYEWFEETRINFNYDLISTAHHLDDSIETFFINLVRGTGIKGLTGIPVRSGKIIRPLLFAGKDQILEFALMHKLSWREDASNQSDAYLRNKIRHSLIPVLTEIQPGFTKRMGSNLDHLQLASLAYDELIKKLQKQFLLKKAKDQWEIRIKDLSRLKEAEQMLSALLHSIGITISANSILSAGQTGKVFIEGEFRLLLDRGKLKIEKRRGKDKGSIKIRKANQEFSLDNIRIDLAIKSLDAKLNFRQNPSIQYLDLDKLQFPLELRTWEAGDFFYPLGLGHKKKLSDFLTDKKISLFDKEKCRVFLSGGDIVCILGLGIDDRFKVSETTKRVFEIRNSPV
ncbi:MAG: tRNA lysidine(34) synthetase TilS [Bacteroidetes bacterium]|nr:tRNA lysidine(34) synthetase TilS [Bacteroidota bacterium]